MLPYALQLFLKLLIIIIQLQVWMNRLVVGLKYIEMNLIFNLVIMYLIIFNLVISLMLILLINAILTLDKMSQT